MPSSRLARRSRLTRPAQPPIAVAVPLFLCLPSSPAPPPAPPAPSLARSLSLRSLARSSILHGEHTARLAALRRPRLDGQRGLTKTPPLSKPRARNPPIPVPCSCGAPFMAGFSLSWYRANTRGIVPAQQSPLSPPFHPGISPPPPPPLRPRRARGVLASGCAPPISPRHTG